ncbi:hypothetical protein WCE37_13675 [Luteimonas sp. MJ250]|uniref:hypothetical protein n=1 Tax=Luteimonas sp. MJ250 TaxID=3129236 RepID=UPI0031BB5882
MADLFKAVAKAIMVLGGGLLILCLAMAAFLFVIFLPSRDEVARIASPSGDLIATVVEIDGGATTSFGYEVRVARGGLSLGGSEVASLYGAVRSESAYGVNLRWVSDDVLHIEYLEAKSAHLVSPGILAPEVQVVLASGISDPLAPSGGMLYNLEGRPGLGG